MALKQAASLVVATAPVAAANRPGLIGESAPPNCWPHWRIISRDALAIGRGVRNLAPYGQSAIGGGRSSKPDLVVD
jgi:hypothetical protein